MAETEPRRRRRRVVIVGATSGENRDTTGGNPDGFPEASGPVDPESARNSTDSGTGETRRTRTSAPKKTPQIDLTKLEASLLGIHIALATLLKTPELALDKNESAILARAMKDISVHYPVMQEIMDSKIMDHVTFVGVLSGIYGSRFIAISNRLKKQQAEKNSAQPLGATVTPIRQ